MDVIKEAIDKAITDAKAVIDTTVKVFEATLTPTLKELITSPKE